MDQKEPRFVLACGKGACCPEVVTNDDKSVDIYDNDDSKNEHIHLSPEQANLLKNYLNTKI